ncbi:alpha/beta fold hydrolase [Streptomyces bangladeshensis]|uniref:AB hydrolase-1 domain-containing protein n=1 Tax=Streptomyces bangladeshensis TaxID=295352 RepID=A0ABN1ZKB4_9ACTN
MRTAGRERSAARWDQVAGHWVRSLQTGGRPGAPPVVLVPGLGALGYLIDILEGCGACSRSFLLDVPGFGHRRPRAVCPPRIPALAETVSAWLAAVAREPVVVAGHSRGAQVARRGAADHPETVCSLVLQRSLP